MNAEQIIRAAIPNANDAIVDYILWQRTPFPCCTQSARELYKAANTQKRAWNNGIAAELAWRDERIEDGIASMKALIEYANDFGSDINPNLVKAEAGEAIRQTGLNNAEKRVAHA